MRHFLFRKGRGEIRLIDRSFAIGDTLTLKRLNNG
jgi:hypothetical protein